MWIIDLLVTRPNPHPRVLAHLLPPKCCEPRSIPQFFILSLFSPWIHSWIYQGAWGCVIVGHGLDKNELLLRRAQWFNDPAKLAAIVVNYMSISSFSNHTLHSRGRRFLGLPSDVLIVVLMQKMIFIVLFVNFFHLGVTIFVAQPNIVEDVGM
jgi:hypothetical protein